MKLSPYSCSASCPGEALDLRRRAKSSKSPVDFAKLGRNQTDNERFGHGLSVPVRSAYCNLLFHTHSTLLDQYYFGGVVLIWGGARFPYFSSRFQSILSPSSCLSSFEQTGAGVNRIPVRKAKIHASFRSTALVGPSV